MRNLMLVCAGVAIGTSIVSVNLWRELRTERTQNAELRTRLTEYEQRDSIPVMATLPPAVRPPADAAPTASAQPAAMAAPATAATIARRAPSVQEMLKDPEYRKARLAQLRLAMPQSYPGLVKELGLSPDEANRLWGLLAENELEGRTATFLNPSSPQALQEMNRLGQEIQRKQDESLVALLGSSGFRQWQNYQDNQPGRSRAIQLNRTLESLGEPLNDAQMRSLSTALTPEPKRQTDDRQNTSGDERLLRQTQSNQRIIDAAAPNLSARQLETLRATLDQPLAIDRAASRLQRELMESRGNP